MRLDIKGAMLRAWQTYEQLEAQSKASKTGAAELASGWMAKGPKELVPESKLRGGGGGNGQ